MEENTSIWGDIVDHLLESFDVYSPGIKTGTCTAPYIVVKKDGSSEHPTCSTNIDLYAIMCYVPKQSYSTLETLVQAVKASMKGMEPKVLPYGQQTPSYYDNDIGAHMVSIEYKNYKKML